MEEYPIFGRLLTDRKSREQLLVSKCVKTFLWKSYPCLCTDTAANEDPRAPCSGLPPEGLPQPDENNPILSSVQHHSSNTSPSTKQFSCSFPVPSLCKGQSKPTPSCFLPDNFFVAEFVLKSDCHTAKVC